MKEEEKKCLRKHGEVGAVTVRTLGLTGYICLLLSTILLFFEVLIRSDWREC